MSAYTALEDASRKTAELLGDFGAVAERPEMGTVYDCVQASLPADISVSSAIGKLNACLETVFAVYRRAGGNVGHIVFVVEEGKIICRAAGGKFGFPADPAEVSKLEAAHRQTTADQAAILAKPGLTQTEMKEAGAHFLKEARAIQAVFAEWEMTNV